MFDADWKDLIILAMVLVFLGFCCHTLTEHDIKKLQQTKTNQVEQAK